MEEENLKFLSQSHVFKTLRTMQTNGVLCDLELVADDGECVFVHSLIWVAAFEYVGDFECKDKRFQFTMKHLDIPRVDGKLLSAIVAFIYGENIEINKHSELVDTLRRLGMQSSNIFYNGISESTSDMSNVVDTSNNVVLAEKDIQDDQKKVDISDIEIGKEIDKTIIELNSNTEKLYDNIKIQTDCSSVSAVDTVTVKVEFDFPEDSECPKRRMPDETSDTEFQSGKENSLVTNRIDFQGALKNEPLSPSDFEVTDNAFNREEIYQSPTEQYDIDRHNIRRDKLVTDSPEMDAEITKTLPDIPKRKFPVGRKELLDSETNLVKQSNTDSMNCVEVLTLAAFMPISGDNNGKFRQIIPKLGQGQLPLTTNRAAESVTVDRIASENALKTFHSDSCIPSRLKPADMYKNKTVDNMSDSLKDNKESIIQSDSSEAKINAGLLFSTKFKSKLGRPKKVQNIVNAEIIQPICAKPIHFGGPQCKHIDKNAVKNVLKRHTSGTWINHFPKQSKKMKLSGDLHIVETSKSAPVCADSSTTTAIPSINSITVSLSNETSIIDSIKSTSNSLHPIRSEPVNTTATTVSALTTHSQTSKSAPVNLDVHKNGVNACVASVTSNLNMSAVGTGLPQVQLGTPSSCFVFGGQSNIPVNPIFPTVPHFVQTANIIPQPYCYPTYQLLPSANVAFTHFNANPTSSSQMFIQSRTMQNQYSTANVQGQSLNLSNQSAKTITCQQEQIPLQLDQNSPAFAQGQSLLIPGQNPSSSVSQGQNQVLAIQNGSSNVQNTTGKPTKSSPTIFVSPDLIQTCSDNENYSSTASYVQEHASLPDYKVAESKTKGTDIVIDMHKTSVQSITMSKDSGSSILETSKEEKNDFSKTHSLISGMEEQILKKKTIVKRIYDNTNHSLMTVKPVKFSDMRKEDLDKMESMMKVPVVLQPVESPVVLHSVSEGHDQSAVPFKVSQMVSLRKDNPNVCENESFNSATHGSSDVLTDIKESKSQDYESFDTIRKKLQVKIQTKNKIPMISKGNRRQRQQMNQKMEKSMKQERQICDHLGNTISLDPSQIFVSNSSLPVRKKTSKVEDTKDRHSTYEETKLVTPATSRDNEVFSEVMSQFSAKQVGLFRDKRKKDAETLNLCYKKNENKSILPKNVHKSSEENKFQTANLQALKKFRPIAPKGIID